MKADGPLDNIYDSKSLFRPIAALCVTHQHLGGTVPIPDPDPDRGLRKVGWRRGEWGALPVCCIFESTVNSDAIADQFSKGHYWSNSQLP